VRGRLVLDLHGAQGPFGGVLRVCADRGNRLPGVIDRSVEKLDAVVSDARQVLHQQRSSHAGKRERALEIQRHDATTSDRRAQQHAMQQPGESHVRCVTRLPGHFLERIHSRHTRSDDGQFGRVVPRSRLECRQLDNLRLGAAFDFDACRDEPTRSAGRRAGSGRTLSHRWPCAERPT
jgi:hypothetical protein